MKISLSGWIYAQHYSWEKPGVWSFSFFHGEKIKTVSNEHSTGFIPVMPYSFEIDLPDDWNPVALQVSALEKEKVKLLDAYHLSVASINDRLNKLQALTNEAEPVQADESD